MAFVPTPNGARVVINWAKGNESFSYVFYATKPGFDIQDQLDLAADVNSFHNAACKAYFSIGVSYVNTTVYDARDINGEIVVNAANAGPGTDNTEAYALNTCVCVTLRTASRGRSARGRKYITGFGENHMVAGEWDATAVTRAAAYVSGIRGAMAIHGWTPVIRSIMENHVPQNPAVVRAITSSEVRSSKTATQRRRVDRP